MVLFGEVVTKVLQRLSLVEGLDAQIYAEPRIQLAIQHKFDLIFREYWIPEYTTIQEEHVLDGITGQIVTTLENKVADWRDIHSIFSEHARRPLPLAPMTMRNDNIHYMSIRQNATDRVRWFKILPVDTTGKVYITYRTKPADFQQDSDVIYMDIQLLILGSCWDVLEDDGTNPGASDKFRSLFQDALGQFNRQQFNIPHDLMLASRSTVSRWT